jgi:hypothetical protein
MCVAVKAESNNLFSAIEIFGVLKEVTSNAVFIILGEAR